MNKKIIILTIGLLLISGCGAKNEAGPSAEVNTGTNTKSMETNNPLVINSGGKNFELKDLFKEYSGAIIKTNMGDIKVKFYGGESPLTVNNFLNFCKKVAGCAGKSSRGVEALAVFLRCFFTRAIDYIIYYHHGNSSLF